MASFVMNAGADGLTSGGTINWATDTIKARLVASSATITKDDTTMTPHTAIGTDYTLLSKTKTKNDTLDRVVFDAADPVFTAVAAGSTVGTVTIFKFVTNDAGSTPIASLDITDTATNGGDITISFSTDGIFYLQE